MSFSYFLSLFKDMLFFFKEGTCTEIYRALLLACFCSHCSIFTRQDPTYLQCQIFYEIVYTSADQTFAT